MQHRARAEEERDLGDRMVDHVQQAGGQPHAVHGGEGQQDVREVRDRRIGETALEVRGAQGEGAAVDDRERGGEHGGLLRPGAAQKPAAEAEVHQAHHGEGAGFDDRDRVQQGRDRRRRDRGRGQPAVKREDRGLDAEAEEGQHEHGAQLPLVPGDPRRVQDAAVDEVERVCAAAEHHQEDEDQRRARRGIEDVELARPAGLVVHLVHHERERGEGHELIAEVEREEVRAVGDAGHDPEAHGEEAVEEVLPARVLHVGEGEDRGHGPEHADDRPEHEARAVGAEGDHEMAAERGDVKGERVGSEARRAQRRREHQRRPDED